MIQKTSFDSFRIGELTKGCIHCLDGRKLVLFITGLCKRRCYYCPLPESRMGIDNVWANERKLSSANAISEAIEEAKLCQANGTGITGGDPLLVISRVCNYVKALKKKFGKKFHIHIYLPTKNVTEPKLEKLAACGIDEVRFHPEFLHGKIEEEIKKISLAKKLQKKYGWKVGIEIPAIPHAEKATIKFLDAAKNIIDFLNLNELEISVLNSPALMRLGMTYRAGSVAVKSSEATALKILRWCDKVKLKSVHYCTAQTKNRFQFVNRLKLRLKNVFRPFDKITTNNTLYRAALYLPQLRPDLMYEERLEKLNSIEKSFLLKKLSRLEKILMKEFQIPSRLIELDKQKIRLLTSLEIAKKVGNDLKSHGLDVALVEELPTFDKQILQLEFI